MKCFKCGSENPDRNIFCINCGNKLTVPADLCPQCQSPLQANARFCHICGKSLADKDAVNVIPTSKAVTRPKTNKLIYIVIGILTVLLVVVISVFITAMLAGQWGKDDQYSKTSHEARTETTDEESTENTDEESTKTTDDASSEMTDTNNETAAYVITDENLIAQWSPEGSSGGMIDPDSAFETGDIYDGTWYLFRSDGTYRYMSVTSGNMILNGILVSEGNYSVSDGKIYLTDVKDSWYPDPAQSGQEAYKDKESDDQIIKYRFVDGIDTLIIDDLWYFHRFVGND